MYYGLSVRLETIVDKDVPVTDILFCWCWRHNVFEWKEELILVCISLVGNLSTQINESKGFKKRSAKTVAATVTYWILNLLQVPVAVGVSSYEAVLLYKGKRVIASKGDKQTKWSVKQLILYCSCGIVAGLLGLGGGFILGPLFIGLGIPPQVSSATSTFAMTFSASMSVVEYYLLKRFPIPYSKCMNK